MKHPICVAIYILYLWGYMLIYYIPLHYIKSKLKCFMKLKCLIMLAKENKVTDYVYMKCLCLLLFIYVNHI